MRRHLGILAATVVGIGVISMGLIWDSARLDAKSRRVSQAVTLCGGTMGSIPLGPLGAEYRITFPQALSVSELVSLQELNTLRGSVAVAFVDCDLTEQDLKNSKAYPGECHLFRVRDNKLLAWAPAEQELGSANTTAEESETVKFNRH